VRASDTMKCSRVWRDCTTTKGLVCNFRVLPIDRAGTVSVLAGPHRLQRLANRSTANVDAAHRDGMQVTTSRRACVSYRTRLGAERDADALAAVAHRRGGEVHGVACGQQAELSTD